MKNTVLTIEPGSIEKNYWRELWRYRELFIVLVWRDVSVRYKQTIIGIAWALIQPIITMAVFTIIFAKVANLPGEGIAPYSLMVFAGLLPWQLFASSLTGSSNSLVSNSNLISKVYFPRIILPISAILVSLFDFLITLLILILLICWYQFFPNWKILTLPLFILMSLLASIGPGLWITALNVKYRDFRYVIPFVIQIGLYISPVGFSTNLIPEQWRILYALNPIVGVIDGFRWAILGEEAHFNFLSFTLSWISISLFLWLGIRKFRSMEKSFADLI